MHPTCGSHGPPCSAFQQLTLRAAAPLGVGVGKRSNGRTANEDGSCHILAGRESEEGGAA